jgi:ribosomal-protein-alanine N-acetyltransferase
MHKEDITQVVEIDHEAFPTMWPPANYEHELQTWLAHYIVACEENETTEEPEITTTQEKGLPNLASQLRQFFNYNRLFNKPPQTQRQRIIGFAGFWVMADEAHITNIATRKSHRRRGIGELLLISTIDLAIGLNARILALEVRTSNITAQSLYLKYGFTPGGVRLRYYTDNKEDALVMTTEDITSASFQTRLNGLKQAHSQKWGVALYHVAG